LSFDVSDGLAGFRRLIRDNFGEAICVRGAGQDVVHGDAEGRDFRGESFRPGGDGGANGVRNAKAGNRRLHRSGDDVDDAAVVFRLHAGDDGECEDVIAEQVLGEGALELLERRGENGTGRWAAGIVDENVDGAVLRDVDCDQFLQVERGLKIGDENVVARWLIERGKRRFKSDLIAGDECNFGAESRKLPRGRQADAFAGAADDHAFACQVNVHSCCDQSWYRNGRGGGTVYRMERDWSETVMTTAIRVSVASLIFGLRAAAGVAQEPFQVTSVVDAPTIAGRPVELDAQGKLQPWPMPESTGYSYSAYFLSQWTIVWDQYTRDRLPYYYCCFDFDRTTYELTPDHGWANSTGYLRAMMEGFVERFYPYTGDPHTVEFLQNFVDYEMEHGLTPEGYAWSRVPYPSANPGSRRYSGWSEHGEDFVEPHVVGEDGYAYLRLYEMTGNTKYLTEAIRCADALVKNYKLGNASISPWPFRCKAKDGSVTGGKGFFPYSANVVEPIMLFDELMRLRQGDTAAYQRIRAGCWAWLMKYPMQNNVWVGYFEDVTANMGAMNQVIPLEFARYVLLHPEKDPQWREHSRKLLEWVKTTPKWPKYIVHGATVTTEQGDGRNFCCNPPNQCCDSHSSRLAAVEALYYAKTGDATYKEAAYRTYNWVTYFQGLPGGAHAPFANQWWFTDEFADGPRRMMDAFWAMPEWAPDDESHFLGSLSVVTQISYGAGRVTYSTFDVESTDVLRLNFAPTSVMVGGRLIRRRNDLLAEGYTFDDATHTMRVRHISSRDVDVQGASNTVPPRYVTFDDPHVTAGTKLVGQYPSGVVDWGNGAWEIGTPFGKFGTFNLKLADANALSAGFHFYAPRVFQGVDIYNDGEHTAILRFRMPGVTEAYVAVPPKQLRRFRTGWREVTAEVSVDIANGQGVRFDNLAYVYP